MDTEQLDKLREELANAESEVTQTRADNGALAEQFRADPSDAMREILRRGAAALAAARDRVEAAKIAIAIFEKSGSHYGVVAQDGRVLGAAKVHIRPGASRKERADVIAKALAEPLHSAAEELGVTLVASPERYVRERAGRDADGDTTFDIAGGVEGDFLVPSVSHAAKTRPS